ncbi:MAG TPA: hypothetical protein VH744_10165 [Terriglobales bacterium]|jgi:hypothetical protein
MALGEDQSVTGVKAETSFRPEAPDRAHGLTYYWSVILPRWLDPFLPRLADAFADGAWTAAWRMSAFAPLIALVVGFLVPQVWPGMRAVYTESLLFLALVIAGAIWSGPIGVMMLTGHVVGMLVWGSNMPMRTRSPGLLAYFLPRWGSMLISYLLLAIPAIVIPQQARWLAEEMPLPGNRGAAPKLPLRGILYAFVCGLLIYLWSQAVPALIRPVFTWLRMQPLVEAIVPLQQRWHWLVIMAVTAALVRVLSERALMTDPSRVMGLAALQQQRWGNPERRNEFWRNTPSLIRILLTSALVTLLFSGLYQSWLDALLVAAVTALLELWRVGGVGRLPGWWAQTIVRVPALVRFAIALVLGGVVSYWLLTRPWRGDTFQPVLWATLLTLGVFYFLFPRDASPQDEPAEAQEPT